MQNDAIQVLLQQLELRDRNNQDNNKDFNYQTQSILDYSNISSQVLDAFKTFTDTLSSEIINGECKKEQNSTVYICIIQLRHNSNPLSFNFEDGLFQNSYFEKIINKCFQQLSSNILVFLPVSQMNDQRIVDQLIQNNIQNRIKIIHYFQGAKTMKEFEEIFQTTLSYKYPLLNNQNDDMCYTDLRSTKSRNTQLFLNNSKKQLNQSRSNS
ncbi:hypothetical protein ABPG74_020707 [Tetrahymena malaccensis]